MQQGICAMFRNEYATVIGLALIFSTMPTPVSAQESSAIPEDFKAQLAERDAIIIELQHSVAELNQRLAVLENQLQVETPQKSSNTRPEKSEPNNTAIESKETFRQSDPSRLSVDLLAAERALERTLVEAGALLLPQGAVEVTP